MMTVSCSKVNEASKGCSGLGADEFSVFLLGTVSVGWFVESVKYWVYCCGGGSW